MNQITVEELARRGRSGDSPQRIDVRSPQEYRAGHIPGALNIPMETIESRRGDLDSQKEITLICQSGKRAAMVYESLQGSSLPLAVLAGGTTGWQAAGLPLVGEQASAWSLDRQVRLAAGLLVLAGTLGSFALRPLLALAIFIGGGLTFSGLSGWCGMGLLLAKMPWNQPTQTKSAAKQNLTGAMK